MSPARSMRSWCLSFLVLLVLAAPARAQTGAGCESDSTYSALDFWLGEWDVLVGDQVVGTNRITRVLKGCAILEEWRDTMGGKGAACSTWSRELTGGSRCG